MCSTISGAYFKYTEPLFKQNYLQVAIPYMVIIVKVLSMPTLRRITPAYFALYSNQSLHLS